MAIVTKRINGYGPYAYRVTYVDEDRQQWSYLGPIGGVDPEDLDESEVADLREEGFALARYRDENTAELHKLDVANDLREEFSERWSDGILSPVDDRRLTRIRLSEDAPPAAVRVLENNAEDMTAAINAGAGQAPLSDSERDSLDFTETNVMHARASKALIQDSGIDDWQALYDTTLTVDEHRQVAEDNRESISGDRLDNDEGPSTSTVSQQQAESEQEKQALRYAIDEDDEDAREFLLDRGWTNDTIEAAA